MATASDNFNRADASSLGADWSRPTGEAAADPGIFSNAVDTTNTGNIVGAYWNAASFPTGNDQFSQATIVAAPAGAVLSPRVRQAAGAATYYAGGYDNNNTANKNRRIWKKVAGTWTSIATEAVDIVATDVVRPEAEGTTIRLKINAVEELSVTDSAIASGEVGLGVFHSAADVALLDDWSGGDIAAAGDPEGSLIAGKLLRGGLLIHGVLTR